MSEHHLPSLLVEIADVVKGYWVIVGLTIGGIGGLIYRSHSAYIDGKLRPYAKHDDVAKCYADLKSEFTTMRDENRQHTKDIISLMQPHFVTRDACSLNRANGRCDDEDDK